MTINPLTEQEYAGIAHRVQFRSDYVFDVGSVPRAVAARHCAARLAKAQSSGKGMPADEWIVSYLETTDHLGLTRWLLLFYTHQPASLYVDQGEYTAMLYAPERE